MVVNKFGGLTGIDWYLYIIFVLENCGGLKDLADEVVVDSKLIHHIL